MPEEQDLVRRARTGDLEAMENLFRDHYPRVWRLSWRLLRREDLAGECVQEAFLRAFRGIGKYRGEAPFASWLYRIAVRAATDVARDEQRHQKRARALADEGAPAVTNSDLGLVHRLTQAIAALRPHYSQVFLLYHVMGHTHPEIAAILGIPVGSSKRRLSVARERLRGSLGDLEENANE